MEVAAGGDERLTINHSLLTSLEIQTLRAPILEKVVQTATVHEYVAAVDDAKSPGPRTVELCAFCKGWVREGWLRGEGRQGGGVALEVGRFVLNEGHEDVARVGDLVVVEDGVFG